MLKQTELKKLKALFGTDTDKIINAIKAEEEQDVNIPEITTYTEEQLATRDKEVIAAAKPEIEKTAKKAGIEIANKQIVKKYGLSDVDISDPDKVIAALDAKVATGDNGLKEQIALLQKDKTTLEATIVEKDKSFKDIQRDTDLLSALPPNRNPLITDKEFLALAKLNLQIEEVDGVEVVKRDGIVLRDSKTQAPVSKKDAISQLFADKKWVVEGGKGGRGGNDDPGSGGAGIKTYSKAAEQFIKENPDKPVMSPEGSAYIAALADATTDFDWTK